MRPAGTDLELLRLAALLDVDAADLDGLAELPAEELRALRTAITATVHGRHEHRFRRLAALVKKTPLPLAAKVAQRALGPVMSARVASSLAPEDAVALAQHLDAGFLTRVATHLDPARVGGIVGAMPADLVVDVGRRMLAAGELIALGGLVSCVGEAEAMAVAEVADPGDLLRIGLFTEDVAALDKLIAGLPDERLAEVVGAAAATDHVHDTVLLVGALGPANVQRLLAPVADLPAGERDRFIEVIRNDDGETGRRLQGLLRESGLLP